MCCKKRPRRYLNPQNISQEKYLLLQVGLGIFPHFHLPLADRKLLEWYLRIDRSRPPVFCCSEEEFLVWKDGDQIFLLDAQLGNLLYRINECLNGLPTESSAQLGFDIS